MKISFWLIPGFISIAAVVGVAVASIDHQQPVAQTPVVFPVPASTLASVPASPRTQVLTPSPAISPAATVTAPATTVATPEILSERSPVTINGIGPVRVGMTVAEASRAASVPIVSAGDNGGNPECTYFRPQTIPSGMGFMVTEGHISRVDIWRNSPVTTLSGARIGSTEAEIKALFPGQIEVTPHEYVPGGHYLTFVPRDAGDRNYRMIFETVPNGRVTQFRAGKLPEVTWVEGCS
jgi:hypothetical protein